MNTETGFVCCNHSSLLPIEIHFQYKWWRTSSTALILWKNVFKSLSSYFVCIVPMASHYSTDLQVWCNEKHSNVPTKAQKKRTAHFCLFFWKQTFSSLPSKDTVHKITLLCFPGRCISLSWRGGILTKSGHFVIIFLFGRHPLDLINLDCESLLLMSDKHVSWQTRKSL